ncbi:hypothetical protein [Desulfolithobacter sp.]
MTIGKKAAAALEQWLASPGGYRELQQTVLRLTRLSPPTGMDHVLPRPEANSSEQDVKEDLAQDFALFLVQDFIPLLDGNLDLAHGILTGRTGPVLRYAWNRFCWRRQDRSRTKKNDTRSYLHRKCRDAIGKDKRFSVRKHKKNFLLYCPAGKAANAAETDCAARDGYGDWPAPPAGKGRPKDYLFKEAFLADSALFFWEEAVQRLGTVFFLPVRELTRYLAHHHRWVNLPQRDTKPAEEHSLSADITGMEEHLDRRLALESIDTLAADFISGLSTMSCQIFLWSLEEPPVTYSKMASRLGLPDHNHTYRLHRKVLKAMKKFCSSWPGPPLHDLPEEVGLFFIEAAQKEAKKRLADRNSKQRA